MDTAQIQVSAMSAILNAFSQYRRFVKVRRVCQGWYSLSWVADFVEVHRVSQGLCLHHVLNSCL